jgi:microsomal dipeptidase-like Zn-dependent dipeptidase
MYTVDQQLDEVKAMEAFIDWENDGMIDGDGWYRIVKSPYEARRAIREGKMAVVLGIEVDGLFGCETPDDCNPAWINSELNRYFNKGVRHLFPIHLYNNGFGGSAIYNELWPFTSPLATSMLMPAVDCEFVKNILLGPLYDETAVYEFKLIGMELTKWFLGEIGLDLPVFEETTTGHCNFYGLTDDGEYAVKAMMNKKMVIDIDHLSLPALDKVLEIAIARGYPLISGHSFLHERPLTEHGQAGPPSEAHRTSLQIEILRNLGGMVAPLNPRKSGSSTRDYVHMYRYIVDKMKKGEDDQYPGIAFASDWGAMFLQTAPRCLDPNDCDIQSAPVCVPYDTENCTVSPGPDCKVFVRAEYPELGCEGKDFPILEYGEDWDGDGVEDGFQAVGVDGRFRKQRTGNRVFDFNYDGLAHVGLLPDFIKDLTHVGLTEEDLEPLFHSAEAYIRMWEKIHGGPPKITPVIYGIEGDNGWYVSDVTIVWVIESEATIHEVDGCEEVTIDYDTAGVLLTCFVASDGGEAEVSVLIKRDTVPPEVDCEAYPQELWPPNGKMVPVTVETFCADTLSGFASMPMTTAMSSEPDSKQGKGDRPDDIQGFMLGSPETSGELRSERLGAGPGRTYTLGYTCYDMAGNASSCESSVIVPHDKRK